MRLLIDSEHIAVLKMYKYIVIVLILYADEKNRHTTSRKKSPFKNWISTSFSQFFKGSSCIQGHYRLVIGNGVWNGNMTTCWAIQWAVRDRHLGQKSVDGSEKYRNSSIFSAIQYQTNLVVCNSRDCERIWWWHANFVGARPQLLVTEYVLRVTNKQRRFMWRDSFRRQRLEKFMAQIFLKLTFTFLSKLRSIP